MTIGQIDRIWFVSTANLQINAINELKAPSQSVRCIQECLSLPILILCAHTGAVFDAMQKFIGHQQAAVRPLRAAYRGSCTLWYW